MSILALIAFYTESSDQLSIFSGEKMAETIAKISVDMRPNLRLSLVQRHVLFPPSTAFPYIIARPVFPASLFEQ